MSVRGFHPLWPPISERYTTKTWAVLAEADLHFHASRKVELHQRVDGLVRRLNDVQHTLMGTNFILVARVFVDVRRNQHSVPLLAGRQRNRTTHLSHSTFRGFHDFLRGLIDRAMVKSVQPNTDLLVLHFDLRLQFAIPNGRTTPVKRRRNCTDAPRGCQSLISQTKRAPKGPFCQLIDYSMILATTPAPTVRPPSRIAKRRPSSMAIGAIRVTVIWMLSPGMTISTPSGSSQLPVTSVVRK